jgi:hypothetical protein
MIRTQEAMKMAGSNRAARRRAEREAQLTARFRASRRKKLSPLYHCECCGRFHNGTRYLTEAGLQPYIELFKATSRDT